MNAAILHILPDRSTWVRLVATAIVHTLRDALDARETASWVLSGGSTPQEVYAYLAAHYRDRLPWQRIHIFWGDERYVPHDDPRSNYGMARETLLRHLPVPTENVHPMPTYMHDPARAAQAYESTLRGFFGGAGPRFDLVLLGVGADGHTASLFPGTPALHETTHWVTTAAGPDVLRLTLTYPALNRAATVFVLVRGDTKAEVVYRALRSQEPRERCPIRGIRPEDGDLHWWLDRDAARGLGDFS